MILLNNTTKSEIDQDKVSFPLPSLLLSLLALPTVTISQTRTTTSDVTMHLPSFIVDTPDVKESDLKLNQLTIQSTLSSIQFGDLKIKDRYKTFLPSFTTVLCKNLRWNLKLTGYNRWEHRWKHKWKYTQHEHKILSLHCSQHYSEILQYQELIMDPITYASATLTSIMIHSLYNWMVPRI